MIGNIRVGTPVTWEIGRAGEAPDLWAARTVGQVHLVRQGSRNFEMVEVIAERKNRAGELYTSQELLSTRFLSPRINRHELIDGAPGKELTVDELMAQHRASVAAFRATRQAQQAEFDVNALAGALVD